MEHGGKIPHILKPHFLIVVNWQLHTPIFHCQVGSSDRGG